MVVLTQKAIEGFDMPSGNTSTEDEVVAVPAGQLDVVALSEASVFQATQAQAMKRAFGFWADPAEDIYEDLR
jgi:hypothetical protein